MSTVGDSQSISASSHNLPATGTNETTDLPLDKVLSVIRKVFPNEPLENLEKLQSSDLEKIFIAFVFNKELCRIIGESVSQHEISHEDIVKKIRCILTEKKIDLTQISEVDKITQIGFEILWRFAEEEYASSIEIELLKKKLSKSLKLPVNSSIIEQILNRRKGILKKIMLWKINVRCIEPMQGAFRQLLKAYGVPTENIKFSKLQLPENQEPSPIE